MKSRYIQNNLLGIPEMVSLRIRQKMLDDLLKFVHPDRNTTILDVGVAGDERKDSNFFEKLYPYPAQITAYGPENCEFLQTDFPGLKFIKGDGTKLPFGNKSFDVAVSFATIEHVGNQTRQKIFINELCRTAGVVVLTTPNRWFPLEFHTLLPFVHWLPKKYFRKIISLLGGQFFAKEEHLNLLTEKEVINMIPRGLNYSVKRYRLMGWVSNLMFFIYDKI